MRADPIADKDLVEVTGVDLLDLAGDGQDCHALGEPQKLVKAMSVANVPESGVQTFCISAMAKVKFYPKKLSIWEGVKLWGKTEIGQKLQKVFLPP